MRNVDVVYLLWVRWFGSLTGFWGWLSPLVNAAASTERSAMRLSA